MKAAAHLKHTISQGIKNALIGVVLFSFGIVLSINELSTLGLGTVDVPTAPAVIKTATEQRILRDQSAVFEVPAVISNLGIILVRFNTFGMISTDEVLFRIKELGQTNWYYQHTYKVDQFQPNQHFTFGFPPISDSSGKTYHIELISKRGTATDSVAVSSIEPIVVSSYQLDKQKARSDLSYSLGYAGHKARELFETSNFFMLSLLAFTPFFLFIFWLVLIHTGNRTALNIQRQSASIQRNLDEFFLLDKNKFPALDGVRGIAIVMVLMAHISPYLESITKESLPSSSFFLRPFFTVLSYLPFLGMKSGQIGVNLFFCLSGFLIFMTLQKRETTLGKFMYSRYARLLPTYFIVIMGQLMSLPFIGMILNLFFLVHFFPSYQNVNLHTWTLGYELLFYLVCAVWMIQGRSHAFTRTWNFTFLLIAGIFSTKYFLPQLLSNLQMQYVEMNLFIAFFFGVVLAKLYFQDKKLWQNMEIFFTWSAIPGLIMILLFQYVLIHVALDRTYGEIGTVMSWLFLNTGIFLTFAALLVSKKHFVKSLLSLKYLRIIGVISYSMYLFHYNLGLPLTNMLSKNFHFAPLKFVAFLLLAFLVNILFSVVLFHYLEKPYFLRGKKPPTST